MMLLITIASAFLIVSCASLRERFIGEVWAGDSELEGIFRGPHDGVVLCESSEFNEYVCMKEKDFGDLISRCNLR